MSEEELKNLAREYAHLRAFDGGFFPKEDEIAEDFEVCLRLLSKDYCIVPKRDIADWVEILENYMPTQHSKLMMKIGAKRLFGKELFEQKGE